MRSATVTAALLALACGGCGGGGVGDIGDIDDDDDGTPRAREFTRSVTLGTDTYSYVTYVPVGAQDGGPVPVVLALHGGGGNAVNTETLMRLKPTADREGFVLVRPNGYAPPGSNIATWNAGSCCGAARVQNVDHVTVIREILDDLATQVPVDADRVFAAGHSNGGMMAYRLACQLSGRIAAVAANAAYLMKDEYATSPPTPLFSCLPGRPVPVLHMHGLADTCAPYEGGMSSGFEPTARPPVSDTIGFWRAQNFCSFGPFESLRSGNSVCVSYTGCQNGADVTLCTTEGAGHVWPGSPAFPFSETCNGELNFDYSANDLLWDFFSAHPKP